MRDHEPSFEQAYKRLASLAAAVRKAMRQSSYKFVGLRSVDNPEEARVGARLPPSRHWERGRITNLALPGTSVIVTPNPIDVAAYGGRYLLVVGSNRSAGPGQDRNEEMLVGARVVASFDLHQTPKRRKAEKNGLREARAYASALDALYPPLNEWVFYGNSDSKKALMAAYESLSEQHREAWDAEVRRVFVAHHGGTRATMYRRLKGESASTTSGLSVTTDDVTGAARFVAVYDVDASDVLAHHAQADTPLASRGFGHEKEVVLKPHNDARLVTVIKNW